MDLALPGHRRSGPLGGQRPHAVGKRGGDRLWLCQAIGAAAPSGEGRSRVVSNRGGDILLAWEIIWNFCLAARFACRYDVALDELGQILVERLHAHTVAGLN